MKPPKGSLKLYTTRVNPNRLLDAMTDEGKHLLGLGLNVVLALDNDLPEADFPAARLVQPRELSIGNSRCLEMDYEGIRQRSPDVVIVDNILHVNFPASGIEMRYHNVKDLLDSGISVISSAYATYSDILKNALDYLCGNFSVSLEHWAALPPDEIVTFVVTPKESFHHAELFSSEGRTH
ncbi:MAG: hypothetical protein KGJ59_05870 [Bacteroidota bacterium]|nr:hypothetical protein [Bacteroidota bacterium]